MKNLVLLMVLLMSTLATSQTFNYISADEYAALKAEGNLSGNEVVLSEGMVSVGAHDLFQEFIVTPKAQGCAGYFDPPGPDMPVTFTDDGWLSASPIALPFTFCFFGDNYTQVHMNNNGNISFNGGISAFSSTAFPSNGNEMIAAFWADFDLGGAGTMHATVTPTAAIFNWVAAGYYSDANDKLNTCQIVITDGTDPLVQGGNVAIHYADMQWTTGSASGGTNGFGGTAATAGANRGNNIDFFQIGQFDHEGIDYDGPNGATDGVSWLDDKSFYFDFCSVGNIPPIPLQTGYCDTFQVCSLGDTLDITFPFLSPENSQTTTVSYSSATLFNIDEISNTPGVNGEMTLRIYGEQEAIGVHEVVVTATDDYAPPGVTTVTYLVEVFDVANAFLVDPMLDYSLDCAPVTFNVLNGPYDGYLWETGETTSTIDINNYFSETLSVTLEEGGCKFQLDSLVYVPASPTFNLQGNLFYCEGQPGAFLEIADSLSMGSVTWGLSDPVLNTQFYNTVTAGTYTLNAQDSLGICFSDTTFTVIERTAPSIFGDTIACNNSYNVWNTVSFAGGVWSSSSANITFLPSDMVDNPTITSTVPGPFVVTYIDNECAMELSSTIDFYDLPSTSLSDTVICEGATYILTAPNENANETSYTWSDGTTGPQITLSQPGKYVVVMENACYTTMDSLNFDLKMCDIEAPNVISLADGSQNPLWYVQADGITDFSMVITNRWGNVMFEYSGPVENCFWDGKDKKGDFVTEGTYFYNIDAMTEGHHELKKQGFIHVID